MGMEVRLEDPFRVDPFVGKSWRELSRVMETFSISV